MIFLHEFCTTRQKVSVYAALKADLTRVRVPSSAPKRETPKPQRFRGFFLLSQRVEACYTGLLSIMHEIKIKHETSFFLHGFLHETLHVILSYWPG